MTQYSWASAGGREAAKNTFTPQVNIVRAMISGMIDQVSSSGSDRGSAVDPVSPWLRRR